MQHNIDYVSAACTDGFFHITNRIFSILLRCSSPVDNWLSIGVIYEGLKNYEGGNYAKGELLDFFLDENDPEDSEIFIPMAAALSEGQRVGLPFVSFEQLLNKRLPTKRAGSNMSKKTKRRSTDWMTFPFIRISTAIFTKRMAPLQ